MTWSCEREFHDDITYGTTPIEVSISASLPATRTVIGEKDGDQQNISWSVGDKISVWAKPVGGSAYTFQNKTFTLATFNATFSSADFKGYIDEMEKGTYEYVGFYPTPSSVSDTAVSYSIPSLQNGDYSAQCDVMYSHATGNALQKRVTDTQETVSLSWEQPQLQFHHLMHMIRIRVPDGKNLLGSAVKKLVITFPQNVVGDMVIDASDPSRVLWSNMTNTITVDMDSSNLLDASGRFVWVYIRPTMINGEISFRAYDASGIPSKLISTSINKEMLAQHITPIALTIPKRIDPVYFTFSCPNSGSNLNNLGETATLMKVKQWPNGVASSLGTTSISSTSSSSSTFSVPFYYDTELGINTALAGGVMKVTFESANVDLSDVEYSFTFPTTIASSGSVFNYGLPWLLQEDFSSLEEYNDQATTGSKDLGNVGLPGWSASRTNGESGSVHLRPFWVFGARYQGRLDSTTLSRIKSGKSVKVRVYFRASAEKVATPLQVGWHTTSGTINADTGITNVSGTISLGKGSSLTEYNVTTSALSNNARIAWRTNITSGSWGTYSDTPITDVRIKVVQ